MNNFLGVNTKRLLSTFGLTAVIAASGVVTSCNEDKESDLNLDPVNVAVTRFKIKTEKGTQELDSTFFTIDLDNRVIFNADSLRRGTDISKLVATINFSNKVSEAVIVMSGTTRTGEIDYRENPNDSIDFTGNVQLRVKADNGNIGTTYTIKVNVHKVDNDSLYWDETARNTLPARMSSPKRQKTVQLGETAYCLIEESDGTYTFRKSDDIEAWSWQDVSAPFTFTPDIESLSASDDKLWILDNNGILYSLVPGGAWTSTGQKWLSIIGGYTETIVGLTSDGTQTRFAQYPATSLNPKTIPADFPVTGRSNFVTLTNQWTSSPVAFFVGGRTADGNISSVTWAFDGAEWIKLCEGGVPGLEGASLLQYYNYRPSSSSNTMLEYQVWMLLGGRLEDGTQNRTVYISYDNGVNWVRGSQSLQLPSVIPAMVNCDNVVIDTELSSDLSDLWTVRQKPQRIKYELDGTVIRWECPYIYLFGGYSTDGTLYNTVWRGVLTRLTFTPII